MADEFALFDDRNPENGEVTQNFPGMGEYRPQWSDSELPVEITIKYRDEVYSLTLSEWMDPRRATDAIWLWWSLRFGGLIPRRVWEEGKRD